MAMPVIELTWQHSVNTQKGNTSVLNDDNKSVLFAIKQALIGISPKTGRSLGWTNPWTVVSSSNGISSGASDYWNSESDLVWSTGSHSWVVLNQPGAGIEICLDLSNNNTGYMTQVWSPSTGFSGGDINTRPSAGDQIVLRNNTTWLGGQALPFGARIHVMTSADGRRARVLVGITAGNNAGICLFWLYDEAKDPVNGWTNYNVALSTDSDVNNPVTTHPYLANTARIAGVHAGSPMYMYASNESTWRNSSGIKGIVNSAHIWAPNDFNGEWPLTTLGLTSQTSGAVGRHGQLIDIWFGSDLMHGKSYPDTLEKQFAQFHNIVVPWNGEGIYIRG